MPTERFDVRTDNHLLLFAGSGRTVLTLFGVALIVLVGVIFTGSLLWDPSWLTLPIAAGDGLIGVVGVVCLVLARRPSPEYPVPAFIELSEQRVEIQFRDGTTRSLDWAQPDFDLRIGKGAGGAKIKFALGVPAWQVLAIVPSEVYERIKSLAEEKRMTMTWEPPPPRGMRPLRITAPRPSGSPSFPTTTESA
jgi:hypothetical protein